MTDGGPRPGDPLPPRRSAEELPTPDFARIFDVAPAPFLLLTPDLVIVHANAARLEATATTLEDSVGRHLFEAFPLNPEDPSADGIVNLGASLAEARDTRRPVTMAIQKYDIPMPDGSYEERFWSPQNVPVLDDEGDVVLLLHRSDDITDYLRERDQARQAVAHGERRVSEVEADLYRRTRDLELLNAELRTTSERERRTARSLAGLARTVAALAAAETTTQLLHLLFEAGRSALGTDAAAVALCGPGGTLTVTESRGNRLLTADLAADSSLPMAVAATTGRPVLVDDVDRIEADSAEAAGFGRALGIASWVALPLRAGGQLLGSWTVGWTQTRDSTEDLPVLEAYAAQCAQAVDRVTRLEAERRRASATRSLAESLQRSLLTDPPQPDHLRIAVRYRPAAQEAQVGGDWYDAFLSPDGATTLVIGDVAGHDRAAAAVMGQVRNMLRGIAHALDAPPATVLAALDRALRGLDVTTLVTGVLARVEQTPEQAAAGLRSLRWSNAGHPPPVLVSAGGTAQLLERPRNLLLGVDPHTPRTEHAVPLEPGDTVVLYTDGLVERRDATLDEGLDRLLGLAEELADRPVEELGDALLAGLAPEPDDDVAVLVLRVGVEG